MSSLEKSRVANLREQHILDTGPEDRFDRITAMAAAHFGAPIALVSLVDSDRQWFKSGFGLSVPETPRDWSFCDHAIRLGGHEVMVVEDATRDPRFMNIPLVVGPPFIRFYAGAVLTTAAGFNLGTLCVIDTQPRIRPTDADLDHLKALAALVIDQIELSQARCNLEERHRLLDLAESLSHVGYWTLKTDTGTVFWSPELYRIHGADPADFNPGLDDALAFYVEDDRAMVSDLIAFNAATGQGWQFDAVIIRRSDGARRNVRSVAECEKDAAGRVTGFFGVFQDLTEERRAVEKTVEQERRYRLLADNASDVIAVYDVEGVFSYLSPSIADLLGYAPEDLIGRRTFDIIVPEDHKRIAAEFNAALKSGDSLTVEYRAVSKDGEIRWLEARPRFQHDENGNVTEINDSVRDVTDRREREVALKAAQAEAEAAAMAKAEFLANMSHEIRTPLNGVLGFADVLAETDLTPDQVQHVERIRTAGRGLSALIDDILDFSKIEAGKMTLEQRTFDLRALTAEVVDLTRSGVGDRLAFDLTFPDDLGNWVQGDEQRTRQVLLNLLGNAAKFTDKGSIHLCVSIRADVIEFRVTDTGVGIEPDLLSRLFEGFTQADTSIGRRFGGTGLGLSISRSLANLMDGDIQLESEPGLGTTAIFTLPYRPTSAPAARRKLSARAKSGSRPGLRVLTVDDVETNLELIDIILSRAGHTVVGAVSGEAAISILKSDPKFDLVLMDVQMPGMDGLDTTRLIRELDGSVGRIPVVALTANVMAEQVAACRAAGMDGHLGKPVRREDLLTVLERVDGQRETRDAKPEAAAPADPFKELKDRYRVRLAALPEEFVQALGLPGPERASAISVLAHSIAGTAGSLGFPDVSDAAFALEAAADNPESDTTGRDSVESLIDDLLEAVAAA